MKSGREILPGIGEPCDFTLALTVRCEIASTGEDSRLLPAMMCCEWCVRCVLDTCTCVLYDLEALSPALPLRTLALSVPGLSRGAAVPR